MSARWVGIGVVVWRESIQPSWFLLPGLIICSTIDWAFALFASSNRSRHVLAYSSKVVVDGKALLWFRGAGGLL